MKAAVVIDMPSKCGNCHLVEEWFNEYGEKVYYCPLCRMNVPKNGDVCEKLRPLPQKWTMDEVEPCVYNEGFVDGFNHCIYLITGEMK